MSGPEYLALAWRLPAYSGVLAARIAAEQDEEGPGSNTTEGPRERTGPPKRNDGRRVVSLDDPIFAPYVGRVTV